MFEKEKEALNKLDERFRSLSPEKAATAEKPQPGKSNLDLGMRIVSDLVAGVVVGLGIGMFLDGLFDTKPVFLVAFLLLGGAASFLNVYRTVNAYEKRLELEDRKEK